jgi:hypothetical protein
MNSLPGSSGAKLLASGSTSTGSILERASANANRQLEYLRGKEQYVGAAGKALVYGVPAAWLAFHWQLVQDFLTGVVTIETKLIYGAALAVVLWLIWLLLSNKTFQYTIAMIADRSIEKMHRAAVARDAEGSAVFAINRLRKRLDTGEEAKANVGGALEAVQTAAEEARVKATEAVNNIRGLIKEQSDRLHGRGNPRIKLTDSDIVRAIATKKGEARREYEFWQEEARDAAILSARYAAIQEVLNAVTIELSNMEGDLDKARRRLALSEQTMAAMQASDDLVRSRERRTFDESMNLLAAQANACDGRTRMLLERLDSTIQTYRANQATSAIKDEEFFEAIQQDSQFGLLKPETAGTLAAATEKPVMEDVEALLQDGSNRPAEGAPVHVRRRNPEEDGSRPHDGNDFKDLLGDGK